MRGFPIAMLGALLAACAGTSGRQAPAGVEEARPGAAAGAAAQGVGGQGVQGEALGERHAEGVKSMLVPLGAQEAQVETASLGEEKPRDPGHSESAWARNRRSDILYPGED